MLYDSFDFAAPALNERPGSLISVLHAVLVRGYFTKAPALWSMPFYRPNRAVFRPHHSSARPLFLVVDEETPEKAIVRGFRRMTDIDSANEQLPTLQRPSAPAEVIVRKAKNVPFTCEWKIVADRTAFSLWLACKAQAMRSTYKFGDLYDLHGSLPYIRAAEQFGIDESGDEIDSRSITAAEETWEFARRL
jgi:hypothetical protein